MNKIDDSSFHEVDLRAHESEEVAKPSEARPHSTSKIHDFFKKSFKIKRIHAKTTLVTAEEIKLSISEPAKAKKLLSKADFEFSRSSIKSCPFDISGYGHFLLMDEFQVKKPKKMLMMVFLFEKIIIFTQKDPNEESYFFMGNLNMDHVALLPPHKNSKVLELKDFSTSSRFHKDVVLCLKASSEYIQLKWRRTIEKCLWNQLLKAKVAQNNRESEVV